MILTVSSRNSCSQWARRTPLICGTYLHGVSLAVPFRHEVSTSIGLGLEHGTEEGSANSPHQHAIQNLSNSTQPVPSVLWRHAQSHARKTMFKWRALSLFPLSSPLLLVCVSLVPMFLLLTLLVCLPIPIHANLVKRTGKMLDFDSFSVFARIVTGAFFGLVRWESGRARLGVGGVHGGGWLRALRSTKWPLGLVCSVSGDTWRCWRCSRDL